MRRRIKDAEVRKIAKCLADETDETMTRVVIVALRERLAPIFRSRTPEPRAAELLAIGRACSGHLKGSDLDRAEMLYDEQGLPR